ncbi:hypothetical protein FQN53_005658 [Emmonsiellopsis sp. PD_33]|nr:hypothetical protein FQN53_005658 [Emmonsiellopsis sp. PD_33]
MSAAPRGSLLAGTTGARRGAGGRWRGGISGSRPPPTNNDSTRGSKTRAAGRGVSGGRGARGRRGSPLGTSTHTSGAQNKAPAPFRGNGTKPPVFGSRPGQDQSPRPSSPFGGITPAGGSSVDSSRDPRRRHDNTRQGGNAKFGTTQDYNTRYEQLKLDRAKQRAEAIKAGQMADPNQPTSLNRAITPTGTCTDMCPEFERVERVVQKMVDKSEKFTDPETGVSQTMEAKMLKRFRRSAAGYDEQLPSDIRTPKTLLQTMNYLLRHVIEDDESLGTTHKFIWDRTRSIRNDLSIQQLTQAQDVQIAVKCLERIARFHIVSLHLLSSPENTEPFDHHQEREQLNNTFLSLLYYYDDNRDLIKFPNEDEFRAYYIVFSIHDQRPDLEARVQKWPRELLQSPRVQVALELFAAAGNTWEYQGTLDAKRPNAIAQGFYSRFFRLIRSDSVSYLLGCIAEIYFNQVRQTTIRSIWKAYCRHPLSQQNKNQEWTVDDLTDALAFDDNDQTVAFCEEQDLELATNDDGQTYLSWGQRSLDSVAFQPSSQQTFSYEYVESKRCGRTLVALILGMNVAQAASRQMIDESLLQSYTKQNEEVESLFVTDEEGRDQLDGAVAQAIGSDKENLGPNKPAFSWPTPNDTGQSQGLGVTGVTGTPLSSSIFGTPQQSSQPKSQLSPAAPAFTPHFQSPFAGFGKPSPVGTQQPPAEAPKPPVSAQPSTGFSGFGQPSQNAFSGFKPPASSPPAFPTSNSSNLGSSFGSGFGSAFGAKIEDKPAQSIFSTSTEPTIKTSTSAITFGQRSATDLANSSQTPSQPATSSPFAPPVGPKETPPSEPQNNNASKPREALFKPFPGSQSAKQPSIFDKGTPPAFPSTGFFGQPSKDIPSGPMATPSFSFTPAPSASAEKDTSIPPTALFNSQPVSKPSPASNMFSSPFQPQPSPMQAPASKPQAPQFGFSTSFGRPTEPVNKTDDQEEAERKAAAEREEAERKAAEQKKKEAEEAEAKRLENEKREAARRQIERERERKRVEAEEVAKREQLEKARQEEERQRVERIEAEKRKAAKREAALREMARQQEEELRATKRDIARLEAAERKAAEQAKTRREQIEKDIAKRKVTDAEDNEPARRSYSASSGTSETPLTVEELLNLDRSRQKPAQPKPLPPPAPTKPAIDEDELLLSAARMAATTLASGKHFWHDLPDFRESMSPASTPRFSRSSMGPPSSKGASRSPHILVNGYDVALAPETPLGLGRTLSRTEQRIRQTGAKGLASLPIAPSPSGGKGKLTNGKVRKHKRQKREE